MTEPPDLRIVSVGPEGAPLVHHIMRAAFEHDSPHDPPSGALTETIDDVRLAIAQGGAVVVWRGDQAVASARYRLEDDFVYVGRVAVLPATRRQGIASALMRWLEDVAAHAGRARVQVGVRMSLPDNVSLYRRLGYELVDVSPHPRGRDMVATMTKWLHESSDPEHPAGADHGAMLPPESRAVAAFRRQFGEDPDVVAGAPGRVNLVGDHTDYNGGFVLPCAIDRRVAVAAGRGEGWLFSDNFDDRAPADESGRDTWAAYPRGVAWALDQAGYSIAPFHAAFAGDVPVGSGLSSSAAIEAATAVALSSLFDLSIEPRQLAVLCRRAENDYVGIKSGIMDQYASLLCRQGSALFIDCRSLQSQQIPLALAEAGLVLQICDTRSPRSLVKSAYNERRASCERASDALGVEQLRDATLDDLARLNGVELKRARHVITENIRVLQAVEALRAHDFEAFGEIMFASHASLQHDYEVSTPELNSYVEVARSSGALGARMTGAGFGGCAIALLESSIAGPLAAEVRERFRERGYREPELYSFEPADGALAGC